MSDPNALFAVYEEALVTAQDPSNGEWVDPSFECLARTDVAAVLTAYNPGSERRSWAQNEAANAQLRDVLQAAYTDVWRADGFSPDGTWREPGWLVWGMPVDVAVAIAADFHQIAIYHYDTHGVRSVVACSPGDGSSA